LKHHSSYIDASVDKMSIFDRSKSSKKNNSNNKDSIKDQEPSIVQNLQKKLNFSCSKKSEDIITILES